VESDTRPRRRRVLREEGLSERLEAWRRELESSLDTDPREIVRLLRERKVDKLRVGRLRMMLYRWLRLASV